MPPLSTWPIPSSKKRQQALDARFQMGGSNTVAEHVGRGVKEGIGHTMEEEPDQGELESRQSEDEIPKRPCAHTDNQDPLQAKSGDTERKNRHEEELGELVERRQGHRRRITVFAQVSHHGREEVIAPEDTDHEGAQDEDSKSGRLEHGEGPKAEGVPLSPFSRCSFGGSIRQSQGIKSEEDAAATSDEEEIRTAGATCEHFHDQIDQDPARRSKDKDLGRRSRVGDMLEDDGID